MIHIYNPRDTAITIFQSFNFVCFMKIEIENRKWLDDMQLAHPLVIAGPCSAETEQQVLETARALKESDVTVLRAGVWKPRTRPGSFEGVGAIALPWLMKAKEETGLKIAIEVGSAQHVKTSDGV